jgi:CTP:molybdopterin cytidylyltransferase MocA
MTVGALVLAAGAGRRFGMPKALASDEHGVPWVQLIVDDCLQHECDPVVVVIGAEADRARTVVPSAAHLVEAANWELGLSESLRVGLQSMQSTTADAALIRLVDQPDIPRRVVELVLQEPVHSRTLRRATVNAQPTHPVLIGRAHWAGVCTQAHGDSGAREYLDRHGVEAVEVGESWDGADHDLRG